jgi:REP element-mobilizing transposase RayT
MPYWQLFYHLVWATKNREPLLAPNIEPAVYGYLRQKAVALGAVVHALNGTETHVHLVASVPPKIAVATFVGQVKAVASTRINRSDAGQDTFYWQAEYGAFSFDKRRLPQHVAYVEAQKEHHAQRTTIAALERTGP